MSEPISRRRLLEATAASGVAVSVAGCTGSLLGGDSACDAGEGLIVALFEGEYDEAAEYYPYEYSDEVDRDEIADMYEMLYSMGEPGELTAISCECSESIDEDELEEANEDDEFSGEIGDAKELRYEATIETDDEETTESLYAGAMEIDGDWYAFPADGSDFDHCD
ncbi:twin-arginine translocation signal domain-containing protein [Natronorubrum sp. DTA28]|uniref:twin-arginine translocation signal domain-containing protein n=1 Tax=Natronorubrum sp. DTA28 TaxID=3447019 RepID=UPI003F87D784